MISMDKVLLYINKLKRIALKEIDRNKPEAAMAAISACSLILYEYNQYYCDEEIEKYIGLPYSKNILKDGKIIKEQFLGGKGNYRQIATETIRLAQKQKIDLIKLTNQEFYNFQKKNHLGIDCSGLVCQLLNFYF